MMVVEDIEREPEELIGRANAAELACGGCVGVCQVSAGNGHIWVHVLRAALARRRNNRHELDGCAINFLFADSLPKQTLDEIGVGRQAIHPLPPTELPVWLQDTVTGKNNRSVGAHIKLQETNVQCEHEGEEQGEQDRGDFCTWSHRSDSLTNEGQHAICNPREV